MKNLITLIALFIISLSAIAQSAEEKVWAKAEALTKAVFETKDSIALKQLVSEKLTYGHSGGNVEDMHTMVRKAVTNTATYKGLTLEKVSVQVLNKTAVVRHLLRATTVDKGTESPLNLHILLVWQKEKGDWRLVARQAVKINPK